MINVMRTINYILAFYLFSTQAHSKPIMQIDSHYWTPESTIYIANAKKETISQNIKKTKDNPQIQSHQIQYLDESDILDIVPHSKTTFIHKNQKNQNPGVFGLTSSGKLFFFERQTQKKIEIDNLLFTIESGYLIVTDFNTLLDQSRKNDHNTKNEKDHTKKEKNLEKEDKNKLISKNKFLIVLASRSEIKDRESNTNAGINEVQVKDKESITKEGIDDIQIKDKENADIVSIADPLRTKSSILLIYDLKEFPKISKPIHTELLSWKPSTRPICIRFKNKEWALICAGTLHEGENGSAKTLLLQKSISTNPSDFNIIKDTKQWTLENASSIQSIKAIDYATEGVADDLFLTDSSDNLWKITIDEKGISNSVIFPYKLNNLVATNCLTSPLMILYSTKSSQMEIDRSFQGSLKTRMFILGKNKEKKLGLISLETASPTSPYKETQFIPNRFRFIWIRGNQLLLVNDKENFTYLDTITLKEDREKFDTQDKQEQELIDAHLLWDPKDHRDIFVLLKTEGEVIIKKGQNSPNRKRMSFRKLW